MTWRDFVTLAKPGIVAGNLLAAIGGYFVATGTIHLATLAGLIFGTGLVIAGSCVINNYLDRNIDSHMRRTAKRPSVTGVIPLSIGLWYAAVLLVVGFALLLLLTNLLTALVGLTGMVFYTVVYGYAKRKTHLGTLVGSLPGATPPVAGYVAVTGHLDVGALLLFLILIAWQMPHFYAIALFRLDEYKDAGLPVLPAVKGLSRTVWEMRLYGIAFVILCFILSRLHYEGFMFGLGMVALGGYWLAAMFSPEWRTQTDRLARLVFKRSLLVLISLSLFWILSHVLL